MDAGRPDSWRSRLLSRGPAGGAVSRRGEDLSRSGGLKGDREMMSSAVVAVPVASGRRVRIRRASRPRMLFCTRRSTDCWRLGVDSAATEGDRVGVRVG